MINLTNRKQVMFFISDIMPSDGLFNKHIGQQQILQTYSVRAGKNPDDMNGYNPGYPTVWDVNFPDVISFQPTCDYHTAVRSLMANADATSGNVNPKGNITDELSKKRSRKTLNK